MSSARDPRCFPRTPHARAKALEREALRTCSVDDFEFISVVGIGGNAIVCTARCTKSSNPFAATKVYAIKIMMNFACGLSTKKLRKRFEKEFKLYEEIFPLRLSYEAAGKRDGLVTYYHMFTDVFPDDVRAMMDVGKADTCFPKGDACGTCGFCYV